MQLKEIKYILIASLLGILAIVIVGYIGILLSGFDANIPISYGWAFAFILNYVVPFAIFVGGLIATLFIVTKSMVLPLKSIFIVNSFILLFIIAAFLMIFDRNLNTNNISFPTIHVISFDVNPIKVEFFALLALIIGAFAGSKLALRSKSTK